MRSLARWLLVPFAPFASALLAIVFVIVYFEYGGLVALGSGAAVLVILLALYVGGRLAFPNRPYYGGYVMEGALGLLVVGAGAAGAFLLWAAIEHTPGETASAREKQIWAALSAALTAYLGSLIIKPEGEVWNPVKSAIASVFGSRFTARVDDLEKDARSAVQNEAYGALASSHQGDVVSGWGWEARRLRTRHIQDQLHRNAG